MSHVANACSVAHFTQEWANQYWLGRLVQACLVSEQYVFIQSRLANFRKNVTFRLVCLLEH